MNKIKVLMIDDNEGLIELAHEYFKDSNISIEYEAKDGVEGLLKIKNEYNNYDVVLLDLIMPHKDGMSVLKDLKREKIDIFDKANHSIFLRHYQLSILYLYHPL